MASRLSSVQNHEAERHPAHWVFHRFELLTLSTCTGTACIRECVIVYWVNNAFEKHCTHAHHCSVEVFRQMRPCSHEIAVQPLGGKSKWLPMNFGYHDALRTHPIVCKSILYFFSGRVKVTFRADLFRITITIWGCWAILLYPWVGTIRRDNVRVTDWEINRGGREKEKDGGSEREIERERGREREREKERERKIKKKKREREPERKREREREREKEREKSKYSSSHSRIYPKTECVTHCGKGIQRSYTVKLQLGQSIGRGETGCAEDDTHLCMMLSTL